jgi:PASTA domain
MLRSLLVAALAAAVLAAPAGAAPPANDYFADAAPLVGDSGSAAGSTIDATKEPHEPDHAADLGGHSVWYRWTAPRDGLATFETCGSAFDTLLAVYTGAAIATLAEVDANDDACGAGSRVVFVAASGTTYRVAVDGWDGAAGVFNLSWTLDALAPASTSPPVLSGEPVKGEVLSVTTGSWARAESFSYRWQRCGGAPTNVARGRLVLASSAEDDHPEAHAVDGNWFTYWNSGMFPPAWIEVELGASYPVDSVRAGVTMLPDGPTSHTVSGRLAGSAHEYRLLGTWSDGTIDQQWLEFPGSKSPELESVLVESSVSPSWIAWRELEVVSTCAEIPGADAATYRLTGADVGFSVRAVVLAGNGGGTRSAPSAAVGIVRTPAPRSLEPPLVTGSPEVGLMLTTTTGRWAGEEPIAYALQWQSCDVALVSCSPILGASQASYFPRGFDIGSRLRVAVTATDSGGTTTAFSEATARVRGPHAPVSCVVPRLRGKTLVQARVALRRSHCRLGAVRRKPSAAVRRGRVLTQRPAAGKRRAAGTRVEVVLSDGRRR